MKYLFSFLLYMAGMVVTAQTVIRSGELWPDDRGQHINAHGGGILCHDGRYYWFGEHKSDNTSAALVGITCYSSDNLSDWHYEGVALPVTDVPGDDLERGCTMERPKVIYNARTEKFVMWLHLELKGKGYSAARYAVAVADCPAGPYRYLRSGRVNAGIKPLDMEGDMAALDTLDAWKDAEWWTPQWRKAVKDGLFMRRDFADGQMARDQTVFVDVDGRAYHIYSSEENLTLQIAELTADYTAHSGRYIRVAPGGQNEAPAIFRHGDTYWLITSGCTGWAPNKARLFSAPAYGDLGNSTRIPVGERMPTLLLADRVRLCFRWAIPSSLWRTSGVPNIPAMPVMSGFLSLLRMECRSSTGMMSGIWIRRKSGMNNPLKRMQKGFCPYRYCR